MVEAEWDDRQNRRIERGLLNARFRYKAPIEDLYYHANRNIEQEGLF
ncbi:hypothetical protein [Segetibacter koreensis]|nr:hypothetical protein [Segetibacter koreensis]